MKQWKNPLVCSSQLCHKRFSRICINSFKVNFPLWATRGLHLLLLIKTLVQRLSAWNQSWSIRLLILNQLKRIILLLIFNQWCFSQCSEMALCSIRLIFLTIKVLVDLRQLSCIWSLITIIKLHLQRITIRIWRVAFFWRIVLPVPNKQSWKIIQSKDIEVEILISLSKTWKVITVSLKQAVNC